jgi:peptidoglycan/xylan/chitin deacetylase (PgdA/CDA1 family)
MMLPSRSRLKPLIYALEGAELLASYAIGCRQPREVWITFDDGPHPGHTTRILTTLHRHAVRATFFWIGESAERHPDIVRRAVDEGHHVGNHSYSHPFLTRLNREAIRREIMRADGVLAPYYQGPKLFRPPHGDHDDTVDQVAAEAGYRTVMWNLSTRDWHRPFQPRRWVDLGSLLVRLMGPSIILMHADLTGTADHLDRFLERIRRLDAHFMPPETLLASWLAGKFV